MNGTAILAAALTWSAAVIGTVPIQDRWECRHPSRSVRRRVILTLLPMAVGLIPAAAAYYGVIIFND